MHGNVFCLKKQYLANGGVYPGYIQPNGVSILHAKYMNRPNAIQVDAYVKKKTRSEIVSFSSFLALRENSSTISPSER